MNPERPLNNDNSDSEQTSEWDILSEQKTSPESIMERAQMYRRFGKVALALNAMEEAKSTKAESHEEMETMEEKQADAFITQLEEALGTVDKSLQNQLDYNIVNHKQINTKDALLEELESGTAIPELDIRFDKDGKPWVSHSPRAGARFLFSKHIHELSSEEVEGMGQRLSLEDALKLVQGYNKDGDHKVVLEIKELGETEEGRKKLLETVGGLLEQTELKDSAVFATLSPDLMGSIHDAFPENSKILNGGIAPMISCNIEKSLDNNDGKEHEFPFKIPGVELFVSSLTKAPKHNDGYGKQTGYLWLRLPTDTVKTLSKMNADGKVGAASLTIVNKVANVMGMFNSEAAMALRKKYAEKVHGLGMKVQAAISKKDPLGGMQKTMEAMGEDTIFYSDTSPGDFAADLPEKDVG